MKKPCRVDECPSEYGSYNCWECPNEYAPTHDEIRRFERNRKKEEEGTHAHTEKDDVK